MVAAVSKNLDSVSMNLFPFQIDSLTGLGVVKVECGSQFSVALTKSGAVYTWYVRFYLFNITKTGLLM